MHLTSLAQLSPAPSRAVIVNCSTKEVSTLALMAALRHAGMPVLLIDCESTDGSWEWFGRLAETHAYDRLQAPLQPHGRTLDWLFAHTRDESILLIDSDLEIRDPRMVHCLHAAAAANDVYGAGFLHREGPLLTGKPKHAAPGRFMERMWIPFVLLKTAPVKAALASGASFMHARDYLEFPWSHHVSRLLYARHRLPLLGRLSFEMFRRARQRLHGDVAPFREYDTGARLHATLGAAGYRLADLGEPLWSQGVHHYHGVTRAELKAGQRNATAAGSIRDEVRERLQTVYGVVVGARQG